MTLTLWQWEIFRPDPDSMAAWLRRDCPVTDGFKGNPIATTLATFCRNKSIG
jgi:hypothetical protein